MLTIKQMIKLYEEKGIDNLNKFEKELYDSLIEHQKGSFSEVKKMICERCDNKATEKCEPPLCKECFKEVFGKGEIRK